MKQESFLHAENTDSLHATLEKGRFNIVPGDAWTKRSLAQCSAVHKQTKCEIRRSRRFNVFLFNTIYPVSRENDKCSVLENLDSCRSQLYYHLY